MKIKTELQKIIGFSINFFLINVISLNGQPFNYSLLPQIKKGEIVYHKFYTLSYVEEHEQAEWVAYELTSEYLEGNARRINDYRADPSVKTGSASLEDYKGSGYDRGHLAPAADMKRSETAMSESFFLSNMSPQKSEFNGGPWRALEEIVRTWGREKEHIYIITGPILNDTLNKIPNTSVSIPEFFYKVILYKDTSDFKNWETISIIMPQVSNRAPLEKQVITVDSLEKLIGIDFFVSLPDSLEDQLEKKINPLFWGIGKTKQIPNSVKTRDKYHTKEVLPIARNELPTGTINTHQAFCVEEGEPINICGCVVSSNFHERSGNTYLNLDRKYPHQIFTILIKQEQRELFNFMPEEYYLSKKVCVRGRKILMRGYPGVILNSINNITLFPN